MPEIVELLTEIKSEIVKQQSTITELEKKYGSVGSSIQSVVDFQKKLPADISEQIKRQDAEIERLRADLSEAKKQNLNPSQISDKKREVLAKMYRLGGKVEKLTDAEKGVILSEIDKKTLSTDSGTEGGYLVLPNYASQIEKLAYYEISPVRSVAKIETIGQGDSFLIPIRTTRPSVQRGDQRNVDALANNNGAFGQKRIYVHPMYADVPITMDMIEDSAYDIVSFINSEILEVFAQQEGTDFISGNGVGKAFGITQSTEIGETKSNSATSFTADNLITLLYGLKSAHRMNASFMMSGLTLAYVLKFKINDNYLWQPSLSLDRPDTILGKPVYEADDLTAPTSAGVFVDGNIPVLCGDFRKGYTIVDRMGMSLKIDETTNYPSVLYRFRKKLGGDVVIGEAIRKLTTATI